MIWPEDNSVETDLVEPERLPEGWNGLPHPDRWNRETTEKFANHIWAGQTGAIPVRNRFQFRLPSLDEALHEFQEEQHPDSELKYGTDARLYVRRLMEATDDDVHAQAEVRSHLPGLPTAVDANAAFTDDDLAELERMVVGNEVMIDLLRVTAEYEQEGPIQVMQHQGVKC